MSKPTPQTDDDPRRFAYDGLERVIHEKARLGIMTSLATHPAGLVFTDLKQLVGLTDGNLNRHLAVLEDAGFVEPHALKAAEMPKRGRGKRPTQYKLTRLGRKRFLEYISQLEQVVRDAGEIAPTQSAKPAKA
ncbi:MAG: transcriptional regulator [Phycisphaerales bacterium JB063]